MRITTVQWNIGGCYIRDEDANPLASRSYNHCDISYVIQQLQKLKPDIVALQEVHRNVRSNQAATIAEAMGMPFCVSDFFSLSHLESGQQLGQSILSRFPIHNHETKTLTNPRFEAIYKDGVTRMKSHDKGITSCEITIEHAVLTVETLQLLPFDPFKIDPFSEKATVVFNDVSQKLQSDASVLLIQGDLNLGSRIPPVQALLPALIDSRTFELMQTKPTIPNGERPDRIVYRGMRPTRSSVMRDTLTDHYPVVAQFEIEA